MAVGRPYYPALFLYVLCNTVCMTRHFEDPIDRFNRQVVLSLVQRPHLSIPEQVRLAEIELELMGIKLEHHYKICKKCGGKPKRNSLCWPCYRSLVSKGKRKFGFSPNEMQHMFELKISGWSYAKIAKHYEKSEPYIREILQLYTEDLKEKNLKTA